MGAWDATSFGNDDAGDWAWELEESDDLSVIEAALDEAIEEGSTEEFVESPTGSEAIAACEVIACLKGKRTDESDYTEELTKWVADHPFKPSPQLLAKANKALNVVT